MKDRAARNSWLMCALAFFIWIMGSVADAHHSFAQFDDKRQVTLTGTVVDFQWTNPHVYIELLVTAAKGEQRHYSIECGSISVLKRVGWDRSRLKVGDTIKVIYFPLRDGRDGGLMHRVTLADGQEMASGQS